MSIEQMRYKLLNNTKYSSSWKWRKKVSSMHDRQVYAVYIRLKSCGEIV